MLEINFLYSLLGTPLGYIMWAIYKVVNNFGWSVIIFTLVVKLASFPLMLKQQKNMAVSQLFTPRVQEIQRRHRGNQQKLQEEMLKLQKEGYNPMGGCGPMIVVLVILWGMIDVVYKPMTHFEHLSRDSIEKIKEIGMEVDYSSAVLSSAADAQLIIDFQKGANIKISADAPQVTVPENWKVSIASGNTEITNDLRVQYGDYINANFSSLVEKDSRLSSAMKNALNAINSKYNRSLQGELYAIKTFEDAPSAFINSGQISDDILLRLENLKNNMYFFGLDLGRVPNLGFNSLMVIPVISFLFSLGTVVLNQYIQKKNMPELTAQQSPPGMKAMMYISPIFSLFISFSVPAGAGFYWAMSYLFGAAQSVVTYKLWPADKLREEAKVKMKKKSVEYNTTAVITDIDQQGNETVKETRVSDMSAKEQKEYYRKKLEEARRMDREKYGDVPEVAGIDSESDNNN